MNPVEVVEPLGIEDRRRGVDSLEGEALAELFGTEHLLLVARRPSEQRDGVDDGGREIAELAVLQNVARTAALAELLMIGAEHSWNVREPRGVPAEGR